MSDASTEQTLRTSLHGLHVALGAKMVPFAGYDMPVQYPAGIMAEHQHCRAEAGLFDVSHMGQVKLIGPDAAKALEALVPGDIQALKPGEMRYTLFTNETGGILDDLIVTNAGDHLFVVVNAGCKAQDIAHMKAKLPSSIKVEVLADHALLALQGPSAAKVMARFAPEAVKLRFMTAAAMKIQGVDCFVTRSGYTGEDGFEISIPNDKAEALAKALLAEPEVKPIGLGARDSLRLEAGLCLYGHDIDQSTTPIEAGLAWAIGKRRREEGGFPGADMILAHLKGGAPRRRVGILPEGRAPAREHTQIQGTDERALGEVTSGGFGPTVGGPIAMGYVEAAYAKPGTVVNLVVRGTPRPAQVVAMPFVPNRYFKP
ncbi:MAG TPA: glycine cleavage system aminomethyltransferase GcvT [Alphaproteobacteria bacterium]|nr:glycine cleavage system aminomethyltransferase GcvT [Alphaproteobacteria bacterium]